MVYVYVHFTHAANICAAVTPALLTTTTTNSPSTNHPLPTGAVFASLPASVQKYFADDLKSSSLTPIQSATLSKAFDSENIKRAPPFLIHSATGSGKTLCYSLPLLSFLGLFDEKVGYL